MRRILLGLVAYGLVAGAAVAAGYEADSCVEVMPSPAFQEAVLAQPAGAESGRVALVIGNGAYQGIAALRNPTNDAVAVAERLGALGFHVYLTLDASDQTILDCVEQLGPRLAKADVGLFYYAGHGIQVDDDNYLIGVNAQMGLAGRKGLVRAADITRRFQRSARTTLVFLDACRNNPFAADANAGLAVADARIIPVVPPEQFDKTLNAQPTGLMVTYATSPNAVAYDGTGKHSPFTQAFLDVVGTPGHSIQQSISEIGRLVGEATNFSQTPWSRSSLTSFLYMNGSLTDEGAAEASRARATEAWAHWQEESDKSAAVTGMLEAFPQPLRDEDLDTFALAYDMLRFTVANETIALDVERPVHVNYSPDATRVVTIADLGGERGRVELWDTASRERIGVLGDVETSLIVTDFSADSSRFMTAENDSERLSVWDAGDGTLIRRFDGAAIWTDIETYHDLNNAALNHDGSLLLLQADNANFLRVIDVTSGDDVFVASAKDIDPTHVAETYIWPGRQAKARFVPGRNAVVVVMWDGKCANGVKFASIDLGSGAVALSPATPAIGQQGCVFYPGNLSDDGTRMVIASNDGDSEKARAEVFDTSSGALVFSMVSPNAHMLPITPDGTALFEPRYLTGVQRLYPLGDEPTAGGQQLLLREMWSVAEANGTRQASDMAGVDDLTWVVVPEGAELVSTLIASLSPAQRAEVSKGRVRWYPDPMRD